MTALRVLFLAHSFPRAPGDAAGSFLLHLAVALRDEDVDVQVVAPSAPGLAPQDTIEGIAVHRFRYAPRRRETLAYTGKMAEEVRGSVGGKLAMLGYLLSGTGAAGRAMHALEPALVHAHWWFPGTLTALLPAAWYRVPVVTTMHGSDVRLAVNAPAAHPLMRLALRRSAAVTTVSSWLAAEVQRVVPGATPLVEPMPVAPGLFSPGSEEREHLLFVGRLNRQKGIADLVEAIGRTPSPVRLVVVGDGPERARLEERARELGVLGRIDWMGSLPQTALPSLYRRAIAVVMPGIGEGLGLVAVEAQLCGAPVIAYASGGAVDTVEHEVTGILVPPGDVGALAAAIGELLGRPDRGASLGAKGRERALGRFTPSAVARRYAAIYRQVLAGSGTFTG